MKRLHVVLLILIIAFIGINAAFGDLNPFDSHSSGAVNLGDAKFPDLKDFTVKKINDTAITLIDADKNMTIRVFEIDNSQKISQIASSAYSSAGYTSNQTINQNDVPVYFLYNEKPDGYSSNVYFSKNNQNYLIKGNNITYENSDYFVKSAQSIVDSLEASGGGGFSRW